MEQKIKEEREVEEPFELKESNAHDASISSTVLDEIIKSCDRGDVRTFEGLLGDEEDKEAQGREPLQKDQLWYEEIEVSEIKCSEEYVWFHTQGMVGGKEI